MRMLVYANSAPMEYNMRENAMLQLPLWFGESL